MSDPDALAHGALDAMPPAGEHARHGQAGPDSLAAAVLQLRLLGAPTVVRSGQPLSISRRKVRALLFRLAANAEPVPREHLAFLFWPDMRETDARRNLTGLLSHLRRALTVPGALVTSGDHIWLDRTLVWSDTAALYSVLGAAHNTPPEALRRLVDQYQGAFLTGFSLPDGPEFEAWLGLERRHWEQRYLAALNTLVDDRIAAMDYDPAVEYALLYLDTDELAEDVHRRLIGIYAAIGDRGAATRQYARCTQILQEELGVGPLPETQAAYQAALETPANLSPQLPSEWIEVLPLEVPMVGRENLIAELDSAFVQASAGHGGVVLLSGEPGIGKSRLMQELVHHLRDRAHLLVGACYPDTRSTPYLPLIGALRPALAEHPDWLSVTGCCEEELALLMPELRSRGQTGSPPSPAVPVETRAGVFEALIRFFQGLSGGHLPVVLYLDDLHWADPTTLDWLGQLGRRLSASRLLVVGSYNSEEIDAVAGLRQSLLHEGVLAELSLERLDAEEILAILEQAQDLVPAEEDIAGLLQQSTGGNPFYLLETLQALAEATCDMDELGGDTELCLPDAIRDAVDARVSRLEAIARQVLEAGAVLGTAFTYDQVQLTAGRTEMETIDGLDDLVARQLLRDEMSGYRFRHQVIRAAVYHGLGAGRRRLLHRRAGQTLEQLHSDDSAAMYKHFDRAGEVGRAVLHALEAGRSARLVFGHAEARRIYDRALALLVDQRAGLVRPRAVAANQRLRIEVLNDRGWVLRLLGEMDAFSEDLIEEARLAAALGDPDTWAHLRYHQAYACRWFCHYHDAREMAEEGLVHSREASDRSLEAHCLREMGLAARQMGDSDTAIAALQEALALFKELGETRYELHTTGNLSTANLYAGDYEEALQLARQALARAEHLGLRLHRRIPLGDIGAAALALGNLDLASDALEESLSIAQQVSDRTQEILCLGQLGWLALQQLGPKRALVRFGEAITLAERVGSCTERSWLVAGLSAAHMALGETAPALQYARQALELSQATGQTHDEDRARDLLRQLGAR